MLKPKAVLMVAPNGAGKGTQTKVVKKLLGRRTAVIVTSELFDTLKTTDPELYHEVQAIKARGELVPDKLTIGLMNDHLKKTEFRCPLICDGFPRSTAQVEALWPMLHARGIYKGQVMIIELDVSDEVCQNRAAIRHAEAIKQGKEPRKDDHPEVVVERLRLYRLMHAEVVPLLSTSGALFCRIPATGSIEEVSALIRDVWPEKRPSRRQSVQCA